MTLKSFSLNQAGFTLSEMLVVMMVTAAVAALGLPRLASLAGSFNRANAKSYLVQDLKRAQAETITQGCRGIITIDSGGNSYRFGCDYLAYDTAIDPKPDKVFFVRNLPERMKVSSTGPIILNSRGQTIGTDYILTNVNLTLTEDIDGEAEEFASGILSGTGVFSYYAY